MSLLKEYTFARRFINDNCIARVPPGSKALPSYMGQGTGYYTWQFYLREALFNPRILNIVVADFMAKYEATIKEGHIQLAGVESASTPILTGIAIAAHQRGHNLNVFSIRKEQKPYGKKNWVEGKVEDNKMVMLIDDLTSTSHKTAIHAASVLFNHAIPVANHIYAMVFKSKTPQDNRIKLLGRDVAVGYMFSLNDFDLELADYEKNKQYYPWELSSPQ